MHNTTVDPALARRLEEARQGKRPTKFRTAVLACLSPSTTRAAFQGIASTRTLTALARVLGVSVDDLTGRREASTTGVDQR